MGTSYLQFFKSEAITRKETDIKSIKEAKSKLTSLCHERAILGGQGHVNTINAANESTKLITKRLDSLENRNKENDPNSNNNTSQVSSLSSSSNGKGGYTSATGQKQRLIAEIESKDEESMESVGPAMVSLAAASLRQIEVDAEDKKERRRIDEEENIQRFTNAQEQRTHEKDQLRIRELEMNLVKEQNKQMSALVQMALTKLMKE